MKASQLVSALFIAVVVTAPCDVRADSIDAAEAKRRGVPEAQVELERVQAQNARLEKQIADLQAQLRKLQGATPDGLGSTAPASAIADAKGPPAARASALKQLELELGDSQTLKLVEVPAGKFMMGSPLKEVGHPRDEELHEVTLTKPYYVGVTVVTVDQFAAFIKDSGFKTEAEKDGETEDVDVANGRYAGMHVKGRTWQNPGFDQKGNYPVQDVSFYDADGFCQWLAKKSGKKVSLPTEAQWEYAARAGVQTAYPWGSNPGEGKGWGNFADKNIEERMYLNGTDFYYGEFFQFDDGYFHTSPVTAFKPNAWGLYDVLGNIQQWCLDGWDDYDTKPAVDPLIEQGSNRHILRGSSWISELRDSRLASRTWLRREMHQSTTGFRIVVNE